MNTAPLALVIEDEVALAALFTGALHGAGFRTRAIHDGQEALEVLRAGQEIPRLVVLDYNLPQVNGLELLRWIRSDERYIDTRVMLATSEAAALPGELGNKADIILLKPISVSQLRELASRFRDIRE